MGHLDSHMAPQLNGTTADSKSVSVVDTASLRSSRRGAAKFQAITAILLQDKENFCNKFLSKFESYKL